MTQSLQFSMEKQTFYHNLEYSIEKVSENKRAYIKELQRKHIIRHLREEEAREANKRLEKLDLISREKLLTALELKNRKIEESKEEKERTLKERQKLAISLQLEKDKALKSMGFNGKSMGSEGFASEKAEKSREIYEIIRKTKENMKPIGSQREIREKSKEIRGF